MSYLKPRNLLLVLALCLALVLLAVIALRYSSSEQLQEIVEALPAGVDVSLQDIDYTHVEDGQAQWRLVSKHVERQAVSGVMGLNRPELSFYNEQGEVEGSLQASKGKINNDYTKVQLRGDVVLKNSGGYTLYTDRIDYDHATQMATTDAHVRLIADGVRLEGTGLVFYAKEERLRLNANVKGRLDTDKMK